MELKYAKGNGLGLVWNGINRTFMELKSRPCFTTWTSTTMYQSNLYGIEIRSSKSKGRWVVGINRTFMELKWRLKSLVRDSESVSIEPLWNWNYSTDWNWQNALSYQSNLYGIEISAVGLGTHRIKKYQSNLYGIEIEEVGRTGHARQLYQSNLYGIEIALQNQRDSSEQ